MKTVTDPASIVYLAYLRRSLDGKKQGDSLSRQESVIKAWCERHGVDWARVERVVEPDHTTRDDYAGHREWHSRIMPRAAKGVVILTEERSRIGAGLDYSIALRDLSVRGGKLVVCASDETLVFDDGIAGIVEGFHGAKNKQEVTDTRARVARALRQRFLDGYWVTRAPFGYSLEYDEKTRTEESCKAWLRVDTSKVDLIFRIIRMYMSGQGPKGIVQILNREGVPGSQGHPWTAEVVTRILESPIYRGIASHGAMKKIKVAGKVKSVDAEDPSTVLHRIDPALKIIPDDLADAIDAARAKRTKARPPNHCVHPLSGFGKCFLCKGSIGASSNGSGTIRYACEHWRRSASCTASVSVRADVVEREIVGALVAGPLSDVSIDEVRAAVRRAMERHQKAMAQASKGGVDLEAEIASLTVQKARALKLALQTDDDADVVASLRAIKARLAALEAQRAASVRPAVDDVTLRRIEGDAVARLEAARASLAERSTLRAALSKLFPAGLFFLPLADGKGWDVVGDLVPCTSDVEAPWKTPPHAAPFGVRVGHCCFVGRWMVWESRGWINPPDCQRTLPRGGRRAGAGADRLAHAPKKG